MNIINKILSIKNLNVEFPIFGGILQKEISKVNAVKKQENHLKERYKKFRKEKQKK